MDKAFDAVAVLQEIRLLRSKAKKKRNRTGSKLDRHSDEILSLRKSGASLADIQKFLRSRKRKVADLSTIWRWLKKAEATAATI